MLNYSPSKDPFVIQQLDVNPYEELIKSIPKGERDRILKEIETPKIKECARGLVKDIAENKMVCLDHDSSGSLLLAALLCLKDSRLSLNQFATLHILFSAIHTLYVKPMVYYINSYVDSENKPCYSIVYFSVPNHKELPKYVMRFPYTAKHPTNAAIKSEQIPYRMRKPLIQRFFNFTEEEWQRFIKEMSTKNVSEQQVHALIVPKYGCWSSIIAQIQNLLKCMRELDILVEDKENSTMVVERVMLVPSFSMFQTAVNVKAKTIGRDRLVLLPTYRYIPPKSYAALKAKNYMPMAMCLPDESSMTQDKINWGRLRTMIDGHPAETTFAGAIHDVYHTFREMSMSPNVAQARLRLCSIAREYFKNTKDNKHKAIYEILIDGELIYSYPLKQDTVFNEEMRVPRAQMFGEIFYVPAMKSVLHPEIKRAFIEDMVVYKEDWQRLFALGRNDLLDEDKKIYDEIVIEKESSDNKNCQDNGSSESHAYSLVQFGTVFAKRQKQPVGKFVEDEEKSPQYFDKCG